MLRDAGDTLQDGQIIEHFGLDDLDAETLKAFRNRFSSREPDHPFLAYDDQGLLTQLGGWRRDRATGAEGLTLAGLLMFGKEMSLVDLLPRFHLDYQEKQGEDPEERWRFRLTLDGRWQPNLFNFYYRIYPRLVDGLNVPFRLDRDSVRLGETHVHQALREALVNALVHADYQGSQGVTVVKRPDAYVFRNPGRLRIPLDRLYEGGVSDPRNPHLQKMFQMLGLGEKSGSGFPKILRAWREQHWIYPMVSEALDLEMTTLTLPLASLIPEEVESELREIVGDAYGSLPELDRISLVLAHRLGEIGNADIQPYCMDHPREIGIRLKYLVDHGWLEKKGRGRGRGTRYQLPGRHIPGQLSLGDTANASTSIQHSTPSSEHYDPDSEHYKALLDIAEPIRKKGRANSDLVRQTIQQLCSGRYMDLRTLAELLGREPDSVRNHYVKPMLDAGLLQLKYPAHTNHPKQAYRSVN
jgi:ATP-dependent DNA helicase RecG